MSELTPFWVLLIGAGIPVMGFLFYAFVLSPDVRNVSEYFLADRQVRSTSLFMTLASSWLSVGNVTFSLIIMGLFFGFLNVWTVVTWGIGFAILSRHARRIRRSCQSASINGFLTERLGSYVGLFAAVAIILIATALLSLELIVGMSVASIVAPGGVGDAFAVVFGFFLALAITGYTMFGGLTAVVKTDRWQFGLVVLAMVAFLIGMVLWLSVEENQGHWAFIQATFWDWDYHRPFLTWEFIVGLACLQFFLMVSDMGSWQRVLAVDSTARRPWTAVTLVGIVSMLSWAIIVAIGMVFSPLLFPIVEDPTVVDGVFAQYGVYITEPLLAIMSVEGVVGPVLGIALVLAIIMGLVGAMMSTGDTYLLVGAQAASMDVPGALERRRHSKEKEQLHAGMSLADEGPVQWSRRWGWLFSLAAFFLALYVVYSGMDFLPLALLLLGSQCALAPVAVLALRDDIEVARYGRAAAVAVGAGFLSSVFGGLYFIYWAPDYVGGSFLPAVIAVGASTLIIVFSCYRRDGWRAALWMVPALFGSYPRGDRAADTGRQSHHETAAS